MNIKYLRLSAAALLVTFLIPQAGFPQEEMKPVPLNKKGTVLLDKQNNRLLLKGEVCLRQGILEMFLCGKQTKEHESIVSLNAKASVVHAGLLALGAKPGEPVRFQPNYKPPQGQEIKVFVNWENSMGKKHRRPVQEWVRGVTFRYFEEPLTKVPAGVKVDNSVDDGLRYDKMNRLLLFFGTMSKEKQTEFLAMSDNEEYQQAIKKMFKDSQPKQMSADFVFAGSGFSKLEDGSNYYQAEGGSFICVANFADAMIDVAIKSSANDSSGRSFEPWTERIPATGTPVTIELIPVPPNKKKATKSRPL